MTEILTTVMPTTASSAVIDVTTTSLPLLTSAAMGDIEIFVRALLQLLVWITKTILELFM